MKRQRNWPIVALLVVLAIGALGCTCLCGGALFFWYEGPRNWSDRKITESQQIGDQIIAEIERYHADHGEFPASLDTLVPDYLPAVPPPTAGIKRWEYERFRDDGQDTFSLAFPSNRDGYPVCFREHGRDWYLDN